MNSKSALIIALLLPGFVASSQIDGKTVASPQVKACVKTYQEADIAVMACVYNVESKIVNAHQSCAVIKATVTEKLKGKLDLGHRIEVKKYYDSDSKFKLEPGTLVFFLLPKSDPTEEIVAASGEMPAFTIELHDHLKRLSETNK
jgi:hypothetical protein